ncbi:AraC family transcriptional regulator [Ancylobacter sp.]|uniref:AraC family transcriptional regulator n=1 Tax=Ancylobacter sp. TaxID=1872567 RepID=UPI003D1207EE
MDPLSDLLSLLKPHAYVSSGFDAGGDWAVQFGDQSTLIKCYAVVSGGCWLAVEGVGEPVRLQAGECFVLPRGRPFRMASDLGLPATPASEIFRPAHHGGVVTFNGGGGFALVGSRFAVRGNHADLLLGLLPPIVHIGGQSGQAALRWSVEQMMKELRERQAGNALVLQHLAHMMLVQALRVHLEAGTGDGWLFALADKQLGAAIRAIHADPAHGWTLQELGVCAGMSRSTFALRFRESVGEPAMQYVVRWRMLLACDRLQNTGDSIGVIALALGYESESAFSTAFKRLMGCSPRQYGREARAMPPTDGAAPRRDEAAAGEPLSHAVYRRAAGAR